MWELDYKKSWVPKKLMLWTVVLEKTLRVPWTASRSNQSILKKISHKYSLEGLMLKLSSNTLATSCDELTHLKRPWCWERLKAGEGDSRGWDGWIVSPTSWTWVWVISRSFGWTGKPGMLKFMGLQIFCHTWANELNWLLQSVFPIMEQQTSASKVLCEQTFTIYRPSSLGILSWIFTIAQGWA